MLQKICNVAYTPQTDAGEDSFFDFLYYLFPGYLNNALKQGVYRAYITREYNDVNVRGPIDVSRHIRHNIPFNGKVAYHTREYTTDNNITQLVRHTIEYIRLLSCGKSILSGDVYSETFNNVKTIEQVTTSYHRRARQQIISKNLRPITHPYYTAYEPLRKLCLAILMHKKLSYSENSEHQINGILFDGASLWEEYLNIVLEEQFKEKLRHPNNRTGKGAQYLFKNDDHQNRRWVFPDFMIGCNTTKGQVDSATAIIDAKYKQLNGGLGRDDSFQMLAYLFRFKSKQGFLLHPVKFNETHRTSSLTLYNDDSIKLTIMPFTVPEIKGSFEKFRAAMREEEKILKGNLII
jgi:5-methylcytosine-specific restriction endonuclease McrBC regulatory subunit McrC